MESEEDVISLVVKCSYLSSNELRIVWEEGGKHAADGVAEPRCEVVQDHFRDVLCGLLPFPLK